MRRGDVVIVAFPFATGGARKESAGRRRPVRPGQSATLQHDRRNDHRECKLRSDGADAASRGSLDCRRQILGPQLCVLSEVQ